MKALIVAIRATAFAAGLVSASAGAHAQGTVYIPDIVELSGAGAVSGTNWRDGIILAIDEINAKGGILGRKIETPHLGGSVAAAVSH